MKIKIVKLLTIVTGSSEEFELEERLINATFISLSLFCLSCTFSALLLGLPSIIWYNSITPGVAGAMFYVMARKYRKHKELIIPTIIFAMLVTTSTWFVFGGSGGLGGLIMFTSVLLGILITKGNAKTVVIVLHAILYLSLLILEYIQPDLIVPLLDRDEHYFLLIVTGVFTLVVNGVIILIFSKNYVATHMELLGSNIELEGAYEEMSAINTQLEERTGKLLESTYELDRANQKLKDLDKLKTNFFANISHEIRTPLTLILSPVESVIQDDYKNEVGKDFFKNIQRNAIRLLRLVNNLLDYSKIEEGRMSMKLQEVDLVKIMKNYIVTIESASESKGIELTFNSNIDSLLLFIDIEKADKIAMNLLSNALKFTDEGGKIEISIREDDKNCCIDVEDTGVGIPADMLDSIFDRFKQADGSSTRKYEGTGIGLSLAKELTELHGGSISVKSKFIDDYPDDHGTTFTLTIPKGRKHFEDRAEVEFITESELEESVSDKRRFHGMREMIEFKEEPPPALPLTKGEMAEGQRGSLLVVEDNSDMRNFLNSLLEEIYTVNFAVDGLDGLGKAKELQPDIIITDVMMPNMDGYEMTQKIKEDENLKRIPVLMLTAKAEIAHKIEGLEYGADDYPLKTLQLKRTPDKNK